MQGLHSAEEYIGRLWENFPPATFLTGLLSDNRETGFLIINIGLFVFGMFSWFFSVLRDNTLVKSILWFWIGLEIINGIGHPIWSLSQGGYTPGLLTAPILLILAILLYFHSNHKHSGS
ncbi:MAG: HXXEE domain-containing protein [Aurantibacter sp.]